MTDVVPAPDPTAPPVPSPAPDPAPAPAPVPVPPAPSPLKPGWQTTEAWLTLLTIVLGAVPSSGLTDNAPVLAKIVGMAIAALSAYNYTAQRTALKRAYLATLGTAPQISKVPQIVASSAITALVVALCITQPSCGAANCQDPKNAQSTACVVEGAVVDCTGVTSLASTVAVVEPIVGKLITSATQPDGTIAWPSIEQQVIDLALQYGTCVIAEIWNDLTAPKGAGSGSSMLARTRLPADFTAEFDRIRARVAPGRKFKTSRATL